MNNKVAIVGTFVLGAIAGACSSYIYLKKKFQLIADEEIESVKAALIANFEQQTNAKKTNEETIEETEEDLDSKYFEYQETDKKEYTNRINSNGYSPDHVKVRKTIYPIDPRDFGEIDDYEQVSLIYYADGVLCDEDNIPIENVEQKVGENFASHIGDYEEDSVIIQNDNLRVYYEIIADVRNYTDTRRGGLSKFSEDND